MLNGAVGEVTKLDNKTVIKAPSVLPVTVEPVSAVLAKYQQKATAPPVTITQFFKAKSSTIQELTLSQSQEKITTSDDPSVYENSFSSTLKDEEATQNSDKDKCEDSNNKDTDESTSSVEIKTKVMVKTISSVVKRSASSSLPAAKKAKQSSIMSSFLKGKSSTKTSNTANCPICSREFSGVSNEEINKHVDNCLIE